MARTNSLSHVARGALALVLAGSASFALAPAAHALPGAALSPAVVTEAGADCASPLAVTAPVSLGAPVTSKAAQIIGGTSALDAIRAQQTMPTSHPLLSGAPATAFEPAAAPAPRTSTACPIAGKAFSIQPRGLFQPARIAAVVPNDAFVGSAPRPGGNVVLGSRMVKIGRTSFDAQWSRVSAARSDLAPTLAATGMVRKDRSALIASVNSWVNRSISHAEDIDLYGRSDYWADAATTLRLGRGDCEDFALLKMELLAAAGVKREDMMLTLARDLIRRRDHAVLLVRTDDGFLMLDNVGSAPLDASQSHGYRPVMSLGAKQNFLHGY